MNTKILFSSNKNDWTTPKDFFDLLNKEFNFTLDPCCYPETVFCNPPYGRETKKWVVKAYEESRKENTKVVMLIPARPDVSYFHDYIQPYALEIRFVRGRLKFGNSKNAAPFPSMVVIF